MHIQRQLPATLDSTATFQVQEYLVETVEYAVARSTGGSIGVTWNDGGNRPHGGYPKTFGHQQWFILPRPIADMVLAAAHMLNG